MPLIRPSEDHLTLKEAAVALGITNTAIGKRIYRGSVKSVRVGTRRFVLRSEVDRVLKEQGTPKPWHEKDRVGDPNDPNLVPRLEACEQMNIEPRTLNRWFQDGILPRYKVGHATFAHKDDIKRLLKNGEVLPERKGDGKGGKGAEYRTVYQPGNYWEMFTSQATEEGMSLSYWIAEQCVKGLSEDREKALEGIRQNRGPAAGTQTKGVKKAKRGIPHHDRYIKVPKGSLIRRCKVIPPAQSPSYLED